MHTIEYADAGLIVKIFTREFGLQSYMVRGGRSKKSKNKINLYQPLTLVDLVVTHSQKNKLERISELRVYYPYSSIPYDVIKSTVAMFLNEVVYKSLKEGHSDEHVFDFIENSLQVLDLQETSCANFHIYFMLQLTRYYGFYPRGMYSESTPYFDLQEGGYVSRIPIHSYNLSGRMSAKWNDFIQSEYEDLHMIHMDRMDRKQLLNAVLLFYQLHIESFRDIKSQEVLEQVIA